MFCTSNPDFYIPSCRNRWADTRPSNGWENNCHKVNFIACSMHLWAGGRCPLPRPWWMAAPSGREWKWEGRVQARPTPALHLKLKFSLTCSKLVFGYIREEMFHLVWWWKLPCVRVNCFLRHPFSLIHPKQVNTRTSEMADVRLWVSGKINYLVYLNAGVILGRPAHSTIDCLQGRLLCFGPGVGWIDIWWSISAVSVPGQLLAACWHQGEAAGRGLVMSPVPHFSLVFLLKAVCSSL